MTVLYSADDGRTWTAIEILPTSLAAKELTKARDWADGFGNVYRRRR